MNLYKFFRKIPLFGTVLGIINSYAYRGDEAAGREFAGILLYFKALWRPTFVSIILTIGILHPWAKSLLYGQVFDLKSLSSFALAPGALSVSVIPSLLGFGIGVYALTFAIPEKLIKGMDELIHQAIATGRRKHGSVLVLNADLGYPLIIMTIALMIGVFQQAFPQTPFLLLLCWLAFWYSIVALFEIVGVLFHLADNAILAKRPAQVSTPQVDKQ